MLKAGGVQERSRTLTVRLSMVVVITSLFGYKCSPLYESVPHVIKLLDSEGGEAVLTRRAGSCGGGGGGRGLRLTAGRRGGLHSRERGLEGRQRRSVLDGRGRGTCERRRRPSHWRWVYCFQLLHKQQSHFRFKRIIQNMSQWNTWKHLSNLFH